MLITKSNDISWLSNEDEEVFLWFLKDFKNKNPKWTATKGLITDKNLLERKIENNVSPAQT